MNRSTWRNLGVVAAGVAVSGGGRDALEPIDAQAQASATQHESPSSKWTPAWPKLPNNWVRGSRRIGGRGSPRSRLDAAPAEHDSRGAAQPGGAAGARVRRDGEIRERVGRPRTGLRLARQRARHRSSTTRTTCGSAAALRSHRRCATLDDDMLLKFDNKGKFLLQIGGPEAQQGQRRHEERQQAGRRLRVAEDQRGCSSPTATATAA